jgi:hypothetical protein
VKCNGRLLFVVVLRTLVERGHIIIYTSEKVKIGRQGAEELFSCCCIIAGKDDDGCFQGVMRSACN